MLKSLFATALVAAGLYAQTVPTPPAAVQRAGRAVLRDLKELEGAFFVSWYPLYAPMTERVAYWEGRIATPRSAESGYAIFRADGYMAEFNTKGAPATAKILRRTGNRPVRISRFGPHYMAVVDPFGKRQFADGLFPRLIIDNVTGMPFAPSETQIAGSTRDGDKFIPKEFEMGRIRQYGSEEAAFTDYVANYPAWFEYPTVPGAGSKPLGDVSYLMAPDPLAPGNGGSVTDGGTQASSESFRVAQNGWAKFDQLEPNDPLNTNKGFYSGCGGQAFFTLFNYHHINRRGGTALVSGDPSAPNYPATLVAMYLNNLRDWLGTFQSFNDLGATGPFSMTEGVDYAYFELNHYSDWVMAYNMPGASNEKAGNMVRDMVAIYGKPMIIGYLSDIHYDVVNEVRTVNGDRQFHIGQDDGKWINEYDIFFAGGAFDFRRVDNAAGYNHGFEHGFNGWYYKAVGQGSITPVLRATDAQQGSGYARMSTSANSALRLWKRINVANMPVMHFVVTARVRVSGPATVTVQARDTDGKPASDAPTGAQLAGVDVTDTAGEWQTVSFKVPHVPAFNFEVIYPSVIGKEVVVDVDNLEVTPVFKQQPPPKQPCIKGKPGLDEGCEI